MEKFIFVCGCPRSGTTVLTQLLNWHPQIALGQERFAQFLSQKSKQFSPALFQPERFFDFQSGDCFYRSFDFEAYAGPFCSKFNEEKYKNAAYTGDKITELYRYFDSFRSNFSDQSVTILFILRDILFVSESYNARARNPNDKLWSPEKDFRQAVADWNKSVLTVSQELEHVNENYKLFVISYDDYFSDYAAGKERLGSLFGKLDLEVDPEVIRGYGLLGENFKQREKNRQVTKDVRQLDDMAMGYVKSTADLGRYDMLMRRRV